LYPLLLVRGPGELGLMDTSWGIYLFSPGAGLSFLTFLPAIRRGREYVRDNGTPWTWPWYPWSFLGMLGAGVCLRGFVLSLSFDPVLSLGHGAAMRLETSYGAYFLVPMLLAVAVLILEIGRTESIEAIERVALGIPAVCVALSVPNSARGAPYAEFLNSFMHQAASPLLVSLILAAIFYVYAYVRRVRFAEAAFVATLLAMSLVRPSTVSFETTAAPQPVVLLLLGVCQLWRGLMRPDSLRVLVGVCSGFAAVRLAVGGVASFASEFLWLTSCLMAVLLIGVLFDDQLARWIRNFGGSLLCAASLGGVITRPDMALSDLGWGFTGCVLALIGLSFLWAYFRGSLREFLFVILSVAAVLFRLIWQCYLQMRGWAEWEGVRSYSVAFVILIAAGAVSAIKGSMAVQKKPALRG
jgi:hypothetical protein